MNGGMRKTSNVQHRTLNIEGRARIARLTLRRSMFDVQRSMFSPIPYTERAASSKRLKQWFPTGVLRPSPAAKQRNDRRRVRA